MYKTRTKLSRPLAVLLALVLVLSLAPVALADGQTYVLMNIPYDEFYAAELVSGVAEIDAVTSATFNKPRTGTLAGGSYHVNSDGSDITGVIYPVLVTDTSVLEGLTEITDNSSVEITVTNRGTTTTTTYVGKDALFEAPSYAYYKLADAPDRYKTLTADGGSFAFSAVSGDVTDVAGVTATSSYNTHHNNFVEIVLNGLDLGADENVSGVIVTLSDGTQLPLKHIEGIWRKTQIGWASPDGIAGKTISNIKYLTAANVYSCDVDIAIKKDADAITAVFTDARTVTVTGLPADIENPVAKVQTQVGRGETATVIAENAAVENGVITTTQAASEKAANGGTEPQPYAVSVTSDNYADLSATAVYTAPDLSEVIGDYQPLFEGAPFNAEYDHYWHDFTAAVVGESAADDTVAYMKTSVGAQGYGDNANAPNFFCGFACDVAVISFGGTDGKTVTYTKTDGSSATYHYAFVKEAAATGRYGDFDMVMSGNLFKATEENAGEFQYLLMFPDTPATTYHLEFRYGDTEENVENLLEGPYAYWVGSAIQSSALNEADEDTIQKAISLFVVENLAEMTNNETNAQRAGLVGTWDCDFTPFPQYANAKMYIELSADGTGKTYADFTGSGTMTLTAEYTFFAYDNDAADGKDVGTYISLNPTAETVTPGNYEITQVNGKKALVFTSNEGVLTYFFREEQQNGGDDDSGSTSTGGGGTPAGAAPAGTTMTVKDVSAKFDDVSENDWYAEAVAFVCTRGLFVGMSDTEFGADETMNRAMLATVIYRLEGGVAKGENTFGDVPNDAYYTDAVIWASENGIVQGTGDGFDPDAPVSREQIAVMLCRYAEMLGMNTKVEGNLSAYSDSGKVSPWATDAMGWAVAAGIINGRDGSTLAPGEDANRAEVATMIERVAGLMAE